VAVIGTFAGKMNSQKSEVLESLGFCPELYQLTRTGEATGRSGKTFPSLGALSTLNNLVILRNLAMALKPSATLEIGLSFGGSCLALTASHRDLGRSPERQHVAIDPFQQELWDDVGLLTADRAGLGGYLDFRPAFSCNELPRLLDEGKHFDLAYIDGSHLFEDCFIDFYFVTRLLTHHGLVIFDDSTDPNVRKVLRFITMNLSNTFELFDVAPFRHDKGLAFRYRLARLLGRTQMTAFRKIGPEERPWDSKLVQF
jgi:hypothetical protein